MLARSWQDQDILSFLGREAPRYTSYPSAHHFGALTPELYAEGLAAMNRDTSIGLYLHIPFCEQMCHFCGCNTRATRRYEPVKDYVEHLVAEINLVGHHIGFKPKVHNLHFGGGSPSILEPAEFNAIMQALHANFDILSDAELSLELDPRRLNAAKVATYKDHGFNRISLGVQDTNAEVQVAINRVQPLDLIRTTFDLLRAHDLTQIGLDLVYGLPKQTLPGLMHTLAEIKTLDPDRMAVFSYAHVPWVKKHQNLIDTATLPGIEDKAEAFMAITDYFENNGYRAVGIDHFAKEEDELFQSFLKGTMRRNFMGYSTLPNDYLLGLGASSIGELDFGIMQNIPQSTTYENRLKSGKLATVRGWVYKNDDKVRKAVISALMCYFKADVARILADHHKPDDYFDADIAGLDVFEKAGLITINNRLIEFVSPLKMLVRSVACGFDTYARTSEAKNRYSKVA